MKAWMTAVCAAFALVWLPMPVEAVGYGQGRARDAQNRPTDAVSFQEEYRSLGASSLTEDSDRILLTFDQGYENGYTAAILDTLAEKNVRAIFFLTGDYAKRETALVKRMIAEGHCLGNHGMKHLALPTLSPEEIETEIMSLHDYVLSQYGYEMQYFRPPCGEYDADALRTVQKLGYRTVFWSAAHVDWMTERQPEPQKALADLTDMAHGGAIYLLHSVSATNAQILGSLIDNLRSAGYTL